MQRPLLLVVEVAFVASFVKGFGIYIHSRLP